MTITTYQAVAEDAWTRLGILTSAGGYGPRPGSWSDDSACARADPEVFFPKPGEGESAALRVCRGCPVAPECLVFALIVGEPNGVWGGLGPRQRRNLPVPDPAAFGAWRGRRRP